MKAILYQKTMPVEWQLSGITPMTHACLNHGAILVSTLAIILVLSLKFKGRGKAKNDGDSDNEYVYGTLLPSTLCEIEDDSVVKERVEGLAKAAATAGLLTTLISTMLQLFFIMDGRQGVSLIWSGQTGAIIVLLLTIEFIDKEKFRFENYGMIRIFLVVALLMDFILVSWYISIDGCTSMTTIAHLCAIVAGMGLQALFGNCCLIPFFTRDTRRNEK